MKNRRISRSALSQVIANRARPLTEIYDSLVRQLQNSRFILLGEATHGTHEFYQLRAEITKHLIENQGIAAVAIEGDWPAVYRVNRYVRWRGSDRSAREALAEFRRFPMWMWRNTEMVEFIEWLRRHNENTPPMQQVGLYGLDMYSLYESVAAVLEYLDRIDPEAARVARDHYGCLDQIQHEVPLSRFLLPDKSCEEKVMQQLLLLQNQSVLYAGDDLEAEEEQFQTEQNARLIASAEAYYRHMFYSGTNTWNMRDQHMFETLENLYRFFSRRANRPTRMVVWEHNSHLGDARATSMRERGQYNVGQLVRQNYPHQAYLLGFTTYNGSVTAASRWDGPAEQKIVRDAVPGSVENLCHTTGIPEFFLPAGNMPELKDEYLQRAIGVLYLPHTELQSHYLMCRLADQFDGIIHCDRTSALEPLDAVSEWQMGEEQTYPFGI